MQIRKNRLYDLMKVLKSFQIVNGKSVHVPVSAYPKSFIQWPVDGSTKNKRIAEVKKQVWAAAEMQYAKMTMVSYINFVVLTSQNVNEKFP